MDPRPTELADAKTRNRLVIADQVVFTSVRSPTGEGYRIIAHSLGVRTEERTEITRRSPSHGALCDQSPHAVGLSAYPLPTGRYCVASSRYAGREQSARGGLRVYTHLVVLDPADYHRFDCNPLRVQTALNAAISHAPLHTKPVSLDPLPLAVDSSRAGDSVTLLPAFERGNDSDRMCEIAAALLEGRPLVVLGPAAPLSVLEWTLLMIPAVWRADLAVCAGLVFSPCRRMQLSVVPHDLGQARHTLRGQDAHVIDVAAALVPETLGSDPWLNLMHTWWNEGRFAAISRLTARLHEPMTRPQLARLAGLCADLDRVRAAQGRTAAQAAMPETLASEYKDFTPANAVEAELLNELNCLLAARRTIAPECTRAHQILPKC